MNELELVEKLLLIFFKNTKLSLYKIAINYLLSPFFMLFILLIPALKNLDTVIYNYIQDNPIFTSSIFNFCYNALMHGFKCFIIV